MEPDQDPAEVERRVAAMRELSALSSAEDDATTVCPRHLRFVPCRQCTPGEETCSTDPADVERTMRYQWGDQAVDHPRAD